ncbi:hypothetical protein LY78DRAFT_39716 [Colletotrichum sublineola]|nr:hypothetical protein LY78DRAFT_39716 [Colletotrichum sublineola]
MGSASYPEIPCWRREDIEEQLARRDIVDTTPTSRCGISSSKGSCQNCQSANREQPGQSCHHQQTGHRSEPPRFQWPSPRPSQDPSCSKPLRSRLGSAEPVSLSVTVAKQSQTPTHLRIKVATEGDWPIWRASPSSPCGHVNYPTILATSADWWRILFAA